MGKKITAGLLIGGGFGLVSMGLTPLVLRVIEIMPEMLANLRPISAHEMFVYAVQGLGFFGFISLIITLFLVGAILIAFGIGVATE